MNFSRALCEESKIKPQLLSQALLFWEAQTAGLSGLSGLSKAQTKARNLWASELICAAQLKTNSLFAEGPHSAACHQIFTEGEKKNNSSPSHSS